LFVLAELGRQIIRLANTKQKGNLWIILENPGVAGKAGDGKQVLLPSLRLMAGNFV
jgi:hypothetical protein